MKVILITPPESLSGLLQAFHDHEGVVMDTETGKEITSVAIPEGVDDIYYDAGRRRLYASCSSGCKAAYGACYKKSQDRSKCQALLQRCLESCIRSKR